MSRKTTHRRQIRRTQANSLRHSGHNPLTYVRYLTGSRLSASFSKFKNYKIARVSSQSGAHFSYKKPDLLLSGSIDVKDICRSRKERREVLFAKGKVGGNHRPPRYTLESLVRC